MQYDYAMEARRCGDTALAEMHLLEMQKRLNGVQEWYKKTMSMMSNDIELDTLSEALIQDYMDRYRDLVRKLDSAKQKIYERKAMLMRGFFVSSFVSSFCLKYRILV